MSGLLWVKMPSKWIADGVLSQEFSSRHIATDIAALKIYVALCHNHKVTEQIIHNNFLPESLNRDNYIDQLEACMTYDDITESVTLSRSLVKRGLDKLTETNLIKRGGTTRKKSYVLVGSTKRSWCKLPRKDLVKKDNIISAFTTFTQRYEHERSALKIFLYLLSVRSNSKRFTEVSRERIYFKTGVKIHDIDGALGFLRSVDLLNKVESRGYLKAATSSRLEHEKLHKYWLTGCETLNIKSVLVESDDKGEN